MTFLSDAPHTTSESHLAFYQRVVLPEFLFLCFGILYVYPVSREDQDDVTRGFIALKMRNAV